MKSIIEDIIRSYNTLWKIKEQWKYNRNCTPIATTNNLFVSVFLTIRGDEYVITDGDGLIVESTNVIYYLKTNITINFSSII